MRNLLLALLLNVLTIPLIAQATDNQKMIELGTAYTNHMFGDDMSKGELKKLKSQMPERLSVAAEFIIQTITSKNKLLSQPYLSRPTDEVLKQTYIVGAIADEVREEHDVDFDKFIDSLNSTDIPKYELIDNYYNMLFTAVGNKNKPFDLSKYDFKMNEYSFKDKTEEGIMFLQCMSLCGMTIWGYINIVKPPNTAEAYKHILKYPQFNGKVYYKYQNFNFKDFEMVIVTDEGLQSYKSYYIDKYYETLVSHLMCLIEEAASEETMIKDLVENSILMEKELYQYTKLKEVLEDIFED